MTELQYLLKLTIYLKYGADISLRLPTILVLRAIYAIGLREAKETVDLMFPSQTQNTAQELELLVNATQLGEASVLQWKQNNSADTKWIIEIKGVTPWFHSNRIISIKDFKPFL